MATRPDLTQAGPGFWTKCAYGLGQLTEGVVSVVFMVFILFYYNQVLGLSGAATGLALFIALFVDAIADPLMGAISDTTRGKLGRRHPFLYAAVIPLPIAFYFAFSPPDLDQTGLFVWLTVFSILTRLLLTVFFVPHLALGAELSSNYEQRNQIVAYRQFFAMVGYLVALVVGFGVFFVTTPEFPDGQMNGAAYAPFAASMGLVMGAAMLISAVGTHASISRLPKVAHEKTGQSLWSDLISALKNHSFLVLILSLLLFFVAFGLRSSLSLHVMTFYWRMNSQEIQIVTIWSIVALVLGVVIWAIVARYMEKRTGFLIGFAGWVALTAWPVLQHLAGLYPERSDPAYIGILLWTGIGANIMGAGTNVFAGSMIADCLDEHELHTGRRQEGAFFGVYTFTAKATTGLGTWLSGIALDAIGFPAQATPGQVPTFALTQLGLLTGPVLIIAGLVSLVVLNGYRLSRARQESIQKALGQRR